MGRNAARVSDNHTCPLTTPTVHVGGPVLPLGAPHTLINGLPAARVADKAFCMAPAPDVVRGGVITVFIDGSPASRIFDKTDVGNIVVGSPNVLLGEFGGGPLTPFQAQWLYDYLASQKEIPYEYAKDGCYARADRMCDNIAALGIPVQEQWVAATSASGALEVPIANYPSGGVRWGWHVAPVVDVAQPGGGSRPLILDPSLNPGGPITVDQWRRMQSPNPGGTATTKTSPDVYFNPYDEATKTWTPYPRNPARTAADLEDYRKERAALPASSGRNTPNAPVHY